MIYRIVQESLANATRHAPGGRVDVEVRRGDDDLVDVAVVNTAATAEPLQIGGSGVGIPGMIDRAQAVGGSLVAVPTPTGGFAVRARIPATPRRDVVVPESVVTSTGSGEPSSRRR